MSSSPGLQRRLGTTDAVALGVGSMIGAGIFVAPAPAAAAAGSGLLPALGLAALVAWCNAVSSARLAARYPASGGTYVYGRERLGPFWGHLAGWAFVVGKTASCAAMALAVGAYAWPAHSSTVAVAVVVAVTAVNYVGVQRSALATRLIVAAVLVVLGALVLTALAGGSPSASALRPDGSTSARGVAEAAGLLFFAFAGYARIATLGEEVRDPDRTIRRAVPLALGLVLVVYAAVLGSAMAVLGAQGLSSSTTPLSDLARAADVDALVPVVRVAAAVAATGALLALLLGVSRTTLAMARDRHLPSVLAAVHPRYGVPHRAELAVGAVVAVLAASVDLRDAIGFSSFCVLTYYAVANASAWTLQPGPARLGPGLGLLGCVGLAVLLPAASVLVGAAVVAVGALAYATSHHRLKNDVT